MPTTVDDFSARVRQIMAQRPAAPVASQPPVAAPTGQGRPGLTWQPLPAGNPQRLTLAQFVQQTYRLDPVRDSAEVQRLADWIAQSNRVMLINWPIPAEVQGLWIPTPQATNQPGSAKPKKDKVSDLEKVTQVVAGVGALLAGISTAVNAYKQGVPAQGLPGGQPAPQPQPLPQTPTPPVFPTVPAWPQVPAPNPVPPQSGWSPVPVTTMPVAGTPYGVGLAPQATDPFGQQVNQVVNGVQSLAGAIQGIVGIFKK
ncbi:MAG: hypothetical protein VKO21_09770 [Candidatus Sericytochromatia bacterium]|nr:hypothetical protein [Candidatus Sericytochromatia bacterium]